MFSKTGAVFLFFFFLFLFLLLLFSFPFYRSCSSLPSSSFLPLPGAAVEKLMLLEAALVFSSLLAILLSLTVVDQNDVVANEYYLGFRQSVLLRVLSRLSALAVCIIYFRQHNRRITDCIHITRRQTMTDFSLNPQSARPATNSQHLLTTSFPASATAVTYCYTVGLEFRGAEISGRCKFVARETTEIIPQAAFVL